MKLFGTVRLFKEEKILVGTHVKRVEKFDEVTNHYLQVFTAQQIRQKGILTVRSLLLTSNRKKTLKESKRRTSQKLEFNTE